MKIKNIFTFIAGSLIGSAISYVIVKKHYEKIINNEMQKILDNSNNNTDIKNKKCNEQSKETKNITITNDENKEIINSYKNIISNNKYKECSNNSLIDVPIIVSGDEVWEVGNDDNNNFEIISLYYFEDGVLTDEEFNPITDIENKVGKDFAKHFGEYSDSVVYVRNNKLKIFYEILLKYEKYENIKDKHYYE